MPPIEPDHFQALLKHVAAEAPDLLAACRWLACGPSLAPLILGEYIAEPSSADIARLAALLEAAPPEIATTGHALLVTRNRFLAKLDIALERLIAADEAWSHPTAILGRPCPSFAQLLAACRDRLNREHGNRWRLENVCEKLERAVNLEARARRRRTGSRP